MLTAEMRDFMDLTTVSDADLAEMIAEAKAAGDAANKRHMMAKQEQLRRQSIDTARSQLLDQIASGLTTVQHDVERLLLVEKTELLLQVRVNAMVVDALNITHGLQGEEDDSTVDTGAAEV